MLEIADRIGSVTPWRLTVQPRRKQMNDLLSSGAWQKYAYRPWRGIIGAKKGQAFLKGGSYDHRRFAVSRGLPPGAADCTTTGLLGTACTPSDQSPASGATRQDSFGTGDGRQSVRR